MIRVPLKSLTKDRKVATTGSIAIIQDGKAEISARVDGNDLVFFPERSSVHKRFLKSIGIEA